jgi:hypothetical protein
MNTTMITARELVKYGTSNPDAVYLAVIFTLIFAYVVRFVVSRSNVLIGTSAPVLMIAICFSYQVYIIQCDTHHHYVWNWLCLPLGILTVCWLISLWRWRYTEAAHLDVSNWDYREQAF